jgi:hypothetical protein
VKTLARFVGHILLAMVKGFVFTGLAAAVLTGAALCFSSPTHTIAVHSTAVAFAATIVVLAACLGAAVALIYHLSHLDTARHAAQRYSAYRAKQRQRPGTT